MTTMQWAEKINDIRTQFSGNDKRIKFFQEWAGLFIKQKNDESASLPERGTA